jgi:hypothetical protein
MTPEPSLILREKNRTFKLVVGGKNSLLLLRLRSATVNSMGRSEAEEFRIL